tara:strand:- start:567 stop:890 length:324 start_codon:yes stop_codon:yes gene_type:complete
MAWTGTVSHSPSFKSIEGGEVMTKDPLDMTIEEIIASDLPNRRIKEIILLQTEWALENNIFKEHCDFTHGHGMNTFNMVIEERERRVRVATERERVLPDKTGSGDAP